MKLIYRILFSHQSSELDTLLSQFCGSWIKDSGKTKQNNDLSNIRQLGSWGTNQFSENWFLLEKCEFFPLSPTTLVDFSPFQNSMAGINGSTIGKIWEGYTFFKIVPARLTCYLEKHSFMFATSLLLRM